MKKLLPLLLIVVVVQQNCASENNPQKYFSIGGQRVVVVDKNKITSNACIALRPGLLQSEPVTGVNLPQMICFLRGAHCLAGAIPYDEVKKQVQGGVSVALNASHVAHATTDPVAWGSYNLIRLALVECAYQLLNSNKHELFKKKDDKEFISREKLGVGIDVLNYAITALASHNPLPVSDDITSFRIVSNENMQQSESKEE